MSFLTYLYNGKYKIELRQRYLLPISNREEEKAEKAEKAEEEVVKERPVPKPRRVNVDRKNTESSAETVTTESEKLAEELQKCDVTSEKSGDEYIDLIYYHGDTRESDNVVRIKHKVNTKGTEKEENNVKELKKINSYFNMQDDEGR